MVLDSDSVSYKYSNHYPEKVMDYLSKQKDTEPLYGLYPEKDNFFKQAEKKKSHYKHREKLVEVIREQNACLELSEKQRKNISLLEKDNGFTVTTGHQLNLFLGPLYYLYKIQHLIKLVDELNQEKTNKTFIPVFWMATEDHDLEEINHFHYRGNQIKWHTTQTGAVGRMQVENIKSQLISFVADNIKSSQAKWFTEAIEYAYAPGLTMAQAHRKLLHYFFKDKGLLIIDGDDPALKQIAAPLFKEEIMHQSLYTSVKDTIKSWPKKQVQVNPREINLFYLSDAERKRVLYTAAGFEVEGSGQVRTMAEMLEEIEKSSEKFSPNVLLRTAYQETILPNVAYVGGGSEINYWLELKSFFDLQKIPFPILVPRQSFVCIDPKWEKKWNSLGLSIEDLFTKDIEIQNTLVKKKSSLEIDFENYKKDISKLYQEMSEKSKQTDPTLANLIHALQRKQEKSFDQMQNRLLKAERRVYEADIARMEELKSIIFPYGKWQERYYNFSYFADTYGSDFFETIYKHIKPFEFDMQVLNLKK